MMSLLERLASIRLLVMDVDGVLTDGRIGYDSAGNELKWFHVADGLGLTTLKLISVPIAWITGRSSPIVARRAAELGVSHLMQGVRDKRAALSALLKDLGLAPEQAAYIGDDWNDLPAFEAAGLRIAVANAAPELRARADYVTVRSGGDGAVREVCNLLLRARMSDDEALERYFSMLCESEETSSRVAIA
jgi:3-deoxy-D-manno-octulosonate 8-phosphate phosphatase (KDO 8-P phosphatase)